jgi:Ras-related protein Rap-1A
MISTSRLVDPTLLLPYTANYCKQAGRGFILAFSLTDQATLKEIEALREQILRLKGDRVPIVVVGTKSDLPDERQVDREQMMNISLGWGVCILFLVQ